MGNLLKGDLVLSYERTFASWVVRKFTGSQWSHVGIYTGNNKFVSSVPCCGVMEKDLPEYQAHQTMLPGMQEDATQVVQGGADG